MLVPLSARAAERNMLVFISDLHMNVDAPYAWLKTNAPSLAAFINRVNAREDVAEFVILGDMLDDWIETVENPPHTFYDILVSTNNADVVDALRSICQNPAITVTYVVGNHDMLTFEAQNKAVITNAIPGLNIISDSPGLGAYSKNNVIWAEHGHRYCMFNAPDIWSRTNGHLPLGYFISRIAASKSAREGKVYTTMDALDTFVKSPGSYYTPPAGQENVVFNDEFINALFDVFALVWGGYWPWDTFTMDSVDHFNSDPSVLSVGNTFDGIYSNWPGRMDIVNQYEAVWNDVGHLSSAANLLFEMPDRIKTNYPFTPRIVLFGHTHKAAFYYHCDATNSIYANTGSWVDSATRNWVEVEINHAGSKDFYTVSLWFDGESTPRQSATLDTLISVNGSFNVVACDFDGDSLADPTVVDSTGNWHAWASRSGHTRSGPYALGGAGYIPLAADFDGDALADPAAVDSAGNWYVWFSRSSYARSGPFALGGAGYVPLAADFDGDRLADPVMVDSSGNWYIWFSRYDYNRGGPHLLTIP
ncbi:MAG: metallophosphoesterase [Kiritimatiellae bacterium]|nr:metallophosphoesterase [Kiritimatiellia bacterium]